MAVLDAGVLVSGDDGDWLVAGTLSNNNIAMTAGKVAANASYLFVRFDNLTMDASTITSAYLSLRASANDSDATALRIYGILANDPTAPTTAADANGRTRTTAFVDWSPGTFVAGTYYNTPDISTIIQELVDASYVYSGTQAMLFYVQDNGSASGVNRVFRTYDHSSTLSEPQLHIEYTPANTTPTVSQVTPNATVFDTLTPSLDFTGSDAEADDIRYQIQISDRDDFPGDGSFVTDSYTPGSNFGAIHPNPEVGILTWQGEIQVDDRPGQSFQSAGSGILDKIRVQFGEDLNTDGVVYVRVYNHQGTYGTSSEPLNPADPDDTPTPGWIAESDPFPFDTSDPGGTTWREFTFSGANRIRLEPDQYYVLIVDWQPVEDTYTNTIVVRVGLGLGHAGNAYIDGYSVPNNGIYLGGDLVFEVYEELITLDKISGTDVGFSNIDNGLDTDPFTSDDTIRYTVQGGDALTEDVTYYWRVRATDPNGSNLFSSWSSTRTFTIQLSGGGGGSATVSKLGIRMGLGIGV